MEMGKLTAKLWDAVLVCFLVEGKEIKQYRNIEIPDELKKLEYQDFKFDVPLNGAITFKIMFEPGVLPEEFPQVRERRTRTPKDAPEVAVSNTHNEAPSVAVANDAAQENTTINDVQEESVKGLLETTQQAAVAEEIHPLYEQNAEEIKLEAEAGSADGEAMPVRKSAKFKKVPSTGKDVKE